MTCHNCTAPMVRLDPGDPPIFVDGWACLMCLAATVAPFTYPKEITLNVSFSDVAVVTKLIASLGSLLQVTAVYVAQTETPRGADAPKEGQ